MSFYIFERVLISVPPIEHDTAAERQLIAFRNGWSLSAFRRDASDDWWEIGLWHGLGDNWDDHNWFPENADQKLFLEWAQEVAAPLIQMPVFAGLEHYTNVTTCDSQGVEAYGCFLSKLPPVSLFDGPDRFGYWRDGLCLWGPVGPVGLELYEDYLLADTEGESRELLGIYLDHCEDHLEG